MSHQVVRSRRDESLVLNVFVSPQAVGSCCQVRGKVIGRSSAASEGASGAELERFLVLPADAPAVAIRPFPYVAREGRHLRLAAKRDVGKRKASQPVRGKAGRLPDASGKTRPTCWQPVSRLLPSFPHSFIPSFLHSLTGFG